MLESPSHAPGDRTTVYVRDFTVPALIGVYPQEKGAPQPLRVGVAMTLASAPIPSDRIEDTVSYEGVVGEIRRLAGVPHDLVEAFAQNLAAFCLADPRVQVVSVRVEKPDIFPEGVVGAEIVRSRS